MSSTMTSALNPATAFGAPGNPASERMLLAKFSWPPFAVAKPSRAFGAMSCTICSIARPSSVPPGESWSTTTGSVLPAGLPVPGRSPLAMSSAALFGAAFVS